MDIVVQHKETKKQYVVLGINDHLSCFCLCDSNGVITEELISDYEAVLLEGHFISWKKPKDKKKYRDRIEGVRVTRLSEDKEAFLNSQDIYDEKVYTEVERVYATRYDCKPVRGGASLPII